MSSNYLPSQLPFLPGNTYADPTITRYHKTQLLGIKDGTIMGKSINTCSSIHFITSFLLEKTSNIQENVDPALLTSMREGVAGTLDGVPRRKDQENDAIPKIAPKWLKYDRHVSPKFKSNVQATLLWVRHFVGNISIYISEFKFFVCCN